MSSKATETLDQKLRARAVRQLKEQVNKALREFEKMIHIQGTTDRITIKTISGEYVEVYSRNVLNEIAEYAIEKIRPQMEEREINDFIRRAEEMQERIDELYEDLGQ